MNRDLVQKVLTKVRERERHGATTEFIYIKGHSSNPGNEAADKLAVRGAAKLTHA